MLNLVFTLLIFPFVPIFFFGILLGGGKNINLGDKFQGVVTIKNSVLGEESSKKNSKKESPQSDNFQRCNLFPVDSAGSESMPVRTKDYGDLKIWAGSSVAIDVDSGTILHYENGRKRTQIASLTKMMTAILAVEKIKDLENETIAVTREALNVPGTVVGCPRSGFCVSNRMYAGEKIKAIDLMKAMLLNSANDAATAIGIHIAGSTENFSRMMNEKAADLNLTDTHFCTPSGLEIDGQEDQCYSTAYDIARIAANSLKYKLIWDIMKIPEEQIYSTDGKYMHQLKNTDILLGDMPNCLGGKTGFTPMAGKSLLLGSTDSTGKHRIIAVVLNDEKRWEDMRTLISWVFDNYEWK
jgi:serine-type D-Ala-D-Ala carboxypeptidase (penicillin-binding protein 5/6)